MIIIIFLSEEPPRRGGFFRAQTDMQMIDPDTQIIPVDENEQMFYYDFAMYNILLCNESRVGAYGTSHFTQRYEFVLCVC